MVRLHPWRGLALSALTAIIAPVASAQVVSPPAPEKVHVDFRYKLSVERDERIRQYRQLTAKLGEWGFVSDAREDADLDAFDPRAERLSGVIPSKAFSNLIEDARIKTVLATAPGYVLPDDLAKLTQVRIELTAGLDPVQQRKLHEQSSSLLQQLG
ncbi:MAG: hypothetical protein ACRCZF_25540, partial [Gemmataceae bacterium]